MRPYRAMAKAAASEESAPAQAADDRLKIALREALLAAAPEAVVHVTPYVYMGHAYLVGFVTSDAQRQGVVSAAQGVAGVRSVATYLPQQPASSSTATDLAIEGEVKAALAAAGDRVTQIDIDVLAGEVVLLGVVADQAAVDAAVAAAQGVGGVSGVTNFLLLPEPGYEKRLRVL
ncbi:BON domain-containing protein [bacterium]|nr:BON domain-containing protein [bacterium]